ncbi:MAG: DUF167 domain-containing protein [Planctomycetota bacterium]
MSCIRAVGEDVEIRVKVVPGASGDQIVGPLGDALKVRVSAPPERGKANAAVASLLADAMGLSAKAVSVVSGTTSAHKVLLVQRCSVDHAKESLGIE